MKKSVRPPTEAVPPHTLPHPQYADRPARLLRLPEVKARVGLSRSSIYARMAEGTFPVAVRLGERSIAWLESSIDAWIAARTTAKAA